LRSGNGDDANGGGDADGKNGAVLGMHHSTKHEMGMDDVVEKGAASPGLLTTAVISLLGLVIMVQSDLS